MISIQTLKVNKSHNLVVLMLLAGLIVLRFPLLILPSFNIFIVPQDLARPLFQNGTYLLIAVLIWWERKRLEHFHIEALALLIFIASPLIGIILQIIKYPFYSTVITNIDWFKISISILLLIALIFTKPKFQRRKILNYVMWIIVATVIGIIFALISSRFLRMEFERPLIQLHLESVFTLFKRMLPQYFLMQLNNAAILEEPLFRGFIWGYLRSLGWKEKWIWLTQAGLFTLAHLYYYDNSVVSLLVIVPMLALVLGLLAWRSRTIGTSMIAHGLMNSAGNLFSTYVFFK